MDLVITVREPLFRGDNLNRKLVYLMPLTIGDIDMLTAYCYDCVDGGLPDSDNRTRLRFRFISCPFHSDLYSDDLQREFLSA